MNLHKDIENFKDFVTNTAAHYGLTDFQVEKDYYVSLLLKELTKIEGVEIVFKGGTSLSKCYDIIDRFSEDIDIAINFPDDKAGRGIRKKLKYGIKEAIDNLGFTHNNEKKVEADRDFNLYEVGYDNDKLFKNKDHMVSHIIIETLVVFKPFPCEQKLVSNYITKFLQLDRDYKEIINQFDLAPFKMRIQTIERTFIDKLFAICDYHLSNKYDRYSRHIYDVHKIWNSGLIKKDGLSELIDQIVRDRQIIGNNTISCEAGRKPNDILQFIINEEVFKDDYNKITLNFLYNPVSYGDAIRSLQDIVNFGLLPSIIKEYSVPIP